MCYLLWFEFQLGQTCKVNGLNLEEKKDECPPSPQRDQTPIPLTGPPEQNGAGKMSMKRSQYKKTLLNLLLTGQRGVSDRGLSTAGHTVESMSESEPGSVCFINLVCIRPSMNTAQNEPPDV